MGPPCTTAGHIWTTPVSPTHSIPFRGQQPGCSAHPTRQQETPATPPAANPGCATAVGVGWPCQGSHPPSPASAKAPRLAYKSGARGALPAVARRSAGSLCWEVSVPGGLRSPSIPPCPTQTPHGLGLRRLAAMNTCRYSMESVAETAMG